MKDNPSAIRASMLRHRRSIGESAKAYRQKRLAHLRAGLRGKRAVYLDINYWIELQKASVGQPRNDHFLDLLGLLRSKVSAGQAFCPISATLLSELRKQTDPHSRGGTARLMDELSGGIGLLPDDDLLEFEVARLLANGNTGAPRPPGRDLVWTAVGCVAANVRPPPPPIRLPRSKVRQLEKGFFDRLLAASVQEVAELAPPHNGSVWTELAESLTAANAAHRDDLASFDEVLASEAMGAIDAAVRIIATNREVSDRTLLLGENVRPEAQTEFTSLRQIGAAFQKNEMRHAIPFIYIQAGLHALLRWNRGQKFDPNDVFDFGHAAGALGYCDYFFTEGPLVAALKRGPLCLADASTCRVVARPEEALEVLRADLREPSEKA